jgi:ABC-type multidrug transport system fused ATPase/permease subunit
VNSVEKTHFCYIVGILVSIIIGLISSDYGTNEAVVAYISFALTLSSILLALVAIVYSFISNASLSGNISGLFQASSDIKKSSSVLSSLVQELKDELKIMSDRVVQTHDVVQRLTNPDRSPGDPGVKESESLSSLLQGVENRSSYAGLLSMYLAAVAYEKRKPIDMKNISSFYWEDDSNYLLGWLMALDAMRIIKIDADSKNRVMSIQAYSEALLSRIKEEAKRAPAKPDAGSCWSMEDIRKIDAYFS